MLPDANRRRSVGLERIAEGPRPPAHRAPRIVSAFLNRSEKVLGQKSAGGGDRVFRLRGGCGTCRHPASRPIRVGEQVPQEGQRFLGHVGRAFCSQQDADAVGYSLRGDRLEEAEKIEGVLVLAPARDIDPLGNRMELGDRI